MEQSRSLGYTKTPTAGPSTTETTSAQNQKTKSPPDLSHSEPCPTTASQNPNDNSALAESTSSVPTLRFPRPLGNRQLTNWISSSSPDIMQPGTTPDEDQSLAELGYDIIGTDGESQAESVASSFDYQRPDDVQSLGGTDTGTDVDTNDVDTDSSDEEEEVILDDTGRAHTYSGVGVRAVDDDDVETPAIESLENPTSLLHHSDSFPELSARGRTSTVRTCDSTQDKVNRTESHEYVQPLAHHSPSEGCDKVKKTTKAPCAPWYRSYVDGHGPAILNKLGLLMLGLALTWASFILMTPYDSIPKTLSTVPVASVATGGASMTTIFSSTASVTSKVQKSLQTASTANSLMPVVVDAPHKPQASCRPAKAICSTEVFSRNEILVKIPLDLKASWLARDAMRIAVTRNDRDIPTNVTMVTQGVFIEVPFPEAYGVFEISIVTQRKPKIHEVFKVDLGQHTITDVIDVSKQFVKDVALYVAHAVNGTSLWVPALDEGANLTQTLIDKLASFGNQAASDIKTYLGQRLSKDDLLARGQQLQGELKRAALDVRDDVLLTLLTAQLSSKLWWLKVQGKTEEYQHYLSKAEPYYKDKRAETVQAKAKRGAKVRTEIRARRKDAPRAQGHFWRWRNTAA